MNPYRLIQQQTVLLVVVAILGLGLVCGAAFADTLYCDQQTEGRQVIDNQVSHPRLKSCDTTDWEHVVPASWCLPATCEHRDKCDNDNYRAFYTDPVNLLPALSCINRSRGNKPYGEISGEATEFQGCDLEFNREVFEPPNHAKPELGLRTLYVAAEYPGLCRFPDGYLDLMRQWSSKH